MTRPPRELSFWDHLTELRERVLKSIFAFLLCSALFYVFSGPVLAWLIRPIGRVIFTAPADAFMARIGVTFLGGFFLCLPVVIYQIWKFVGLALTDQERRYVRIYVPLSLLAFLFGAAFAYFVMLPFSLRFLLGFSAGHMVPMITVRAYISFVGTMTVAGGVVFETPLILGFLSRLGIATPEFLREKRRYAIVLIFIVSAILTPPDAFTQCLMAVPLLLLYEAGIWMAVWARKR